MLLQFVILYLIVSVGIGLYAATKVKNSADFVVAGRHLPLPFIVATVFATWFGSETVLGIPAKFLNDGLKGVVADPFGSSMCLIFVGLFCARPLYRMGLLTIGDYYRARYNRAVELAAAICIGVSEKVMSVFYWGYIEGVQDYSPVVLLASAIYEHCQSGGITILDTGIATEAGEPNYGLIRFKRSLGFHESLKLILAKDLPGHA